MRRLLVGLVVAAVTVLVPLGAMAGNQEVAEQIAANLRNSGQLKSYKIGVKYQAGTAWLRGRVSDQQQMDATLRLVFQTPGVTRVVNDLAIGSAAEATMPRVQQATGAVHPERIARLSSPAGTTPAQRVKTSPRPAGQADRVATTFASTPARKVAVTTTQRPTPAPQSRPTPVAQARPTPVAQARPTPAPQPRPTPVAQAQPASVAQARPTPAPQPRPTPVAQAQPTSVAQAQPTSVAQAQPIPVVQAQPMAVPMRIAYVQGGPVPIGQPRGGPIPQHVAPVGGGVAPARYDQPYMPNYTWPSYAPYPNYAALTYPKQYSPTAWPYIGPFYPYPQVPLGWRKVSLEWHDGWWQLDFDDGPRRGPISGLFRPHK